MLLVSSLLWVRPAFAQGGCLLVPVPLAERVRQATLVVEASVGSPRTLALPGGHLRTYYELVVYKVFKGSLPATGALRVGTPGGTLGLRREDVSDGLELGAHQQGVFLLEADPADPGSWRLVAGSQGLIGYNLAARTATDPFAHYPTLAGALYPALRALTGRGYRQIQFNAALLPAAPPTRPAGAATTQQPTDAPVIKALVPSVVTAGTSTSTSSSAAGVLSIRGAGFGDGQGAGYVLLRNADRPGPDSSPGTVQPLAADYLAWTDTLVQVRVPTRSASGGAAGTGLVQVVTATGAAATSPAPLTVAYALSNVLATDPAQTYRVHLVGLDDQGGYTLHYSPSLPAAAQAPFAAALASWGAQAGASLRVGDPTATDASQADNLSVVRFSSAADALPAGTLGRTTSYYLGCSVSGTMSWQLMETDYVFAAAAPWSFDAAGPGAGQYDFQSVVLHELGHGLQLRHVINEAQVMHYALGDGQSRRTLDAATDLVAARDVAAYSAAALAAERCNLAAYAPTAGPLPVELLSFEARAVPGQGVALRWATASELQAAYFGVESQADATEPWQELARVPAAGTSATPRQYQALDARPLAGARYYRLRQVDADGRRAYSPTVVVQAPPATALSAYPNPATGLVHLRGPVASPGGRAQVRLLDALGRVALAASGPAAHELALTGLPPGLYVLEWDAGAGPAQHLRLRVE